MTVNQLTLRLFGLAMLSLLLVIQIPAARSATGPLTVIESVSWATLVETEGFNFPDSSRSPFDLPLVEKKDDGYGLADNLLTTFITSQFRVNTACPHRTHLSRPPPLYHF